MSKIMKLPSLFKGKKGEKHSWQWPLCKHTKTMSFRAGGDMYKTVNSALFNLSDKPDTFFKGSSSSSSPARSSTTNSEEPPRVQSLETIIRGAQSERLFFEPGGTRSIFKKERVVGLRVKDSVVLAMESEDPYRDFRRSMEEMVETHGLKDWVFLEEMLSWYLRVNRKMNHGFVVGAFVDLLVAMASSSSDDTNFSSADASSSLSSPLSPLSPLVQKQTYQNVDMVIS